MQTFRPRAYPLTVLFVRESFCHAGNTASANGVHRIKANYRDVILFFKVGKFYELYEDDAQIGADALEWKMTITGVGHCRQVS